LRAIRVTAIRITEVGGGDGVVGDSDRGEDALNDGSDGSIGVSLNSRPGEVSSKTVRLDDGAVMGRSADEGGGRDVESVGGGQANQEDGDLCFQ